ncbi:O-methyltransferase [Roseivirga misakiensis]|uniref:SAM-dependent methyltransferase n=1 Tax=Roseivirga misakiensis TaxID=1563681 RepID=A0A1E5T1K6_9BACT|nr:class I SAM-dependent methyltransferase [Roseivirga misakiensis]OEK05187.1 hypothetical protein BFP71_17415 [Roseivirga misakiensis]
MFQVISFLIYWLKRVDEHSLHAPFIYSFFTQVLKQKHSDSPDIAQIHQQMLSDNRSIQLTDFGAGSRVSSSGQRSIRSIAKYASTPVKFSKMMKHLIHHFQFTEVLELGTSLGINTLYLSSDPQVKVTTLEGDPNIAKIASDNFKASKRENIALIVGNIDETLPKVLKNERKVDLVYIDANHRFEPTLRYFDMILLNCHSESIIILDDIHWSKEMASAWKNLISRPEVTLSIDVFEAGLLWINPKLDKQHYILNF